MRYHEKVTSPPLWMGFILITAGIIILLDNLGMTPMESFWQYWPLLLIIIGVTRLFEIWQEPRQDRGLPGQN